MFDPSPFPSSVPSHPPPSPPQQPAEKKDNSEKGIKSNKFGNACLRCRSRKVKCDGRKEGGCLNCARKSFECVFDVQPKRRGPDKLPGRKRRTTAQKKLDIENGVDVKPAKSRPSSSQQRNAQPQQNHQQQQSFDPLLPAGLQRISPQASPSSSNGSPSHEHESRGGPSKRRKSTAGGVVKMERVEDEEGFRIGRPGSSHYQQYQAGGSGGRPLDSSTRAHAEDSRASSVSSSNESSVFAHQHPQQGQGYPSNLPPHHFQLQPPHLHQQHQQQQQQFDPNHNGSMGFPYPTPASLHQQHQSLLQNHHHQQLLPPLSHLPAPFLPHNNGNNNFNPVQQPPNLGLPVESHFPAYFPRNGNGQQQQQILDQQQQQQQQQSQPHFPHQLHQQQHQHQSYVPPPDPFLPYHHSNNDHNSHSGRSYTLPFPQTHQHQHQHDQIPRLSAPIYANYGQQQQQQSNSNQNGRVESNSRPATATSSHSHSHSHFQSQPQPPRPSTATSTSTTTKGKRRASDAALDERAEEEEDEYEEYEDYEEGEQSGDENEQEEEEDVKPDLGRLLQQQQQQQQEQQVFQVRGGGIVMMQQNDPENGARIWEQHEQEGMREGGMTATTTARPSTATACSRPSSSSASSMMISTPPLPSPHNQQLLPASTTTTNANASQILTLPKAPNAEYPRQIWWDFLLSQFGRNREGAYAMVVSQLSNLFKISNHWLAFINIPLFVAKLHHPVHRQNLQPALVYSMLALSSHMSSWDGPGGNGFEGRLLGLQFKEQALTAFWNSWNSGWIDAGLAKAAFLMALYEASAHPLQSDQRSASAMLLLDNVLRTLALPALDVNDPNANMFPKGQIPEITSALMGSGVAPLVAYSGLGLHSEQSTTNCPFWTACPRWSNPHDPTSVQEIEKDESRRLVWSASALAASFSMFRFSVGLEPVDLYIGNPENFALLYPGENLFVGSGQDGKSSIWALYATTAMLWHFALRHHLSDSSEEEKRNQAVKVWTVSRSLEAMFDQAKKRVTGDTEMEWYERIASLAYDWQSRDWLLTSRMLVSDSFSRFIPDASSHEIINDFHVASARHWLYTQSGVAKYLNPVNQSQASSDARALINHRPVWIFWFMQQLTRALHLYELNPEFTEALTVVREDLAPMLQFLLNLYPSEGLFDSLTVIISRLNEANRQASFPEVVLHFPAVLNGEEVRSLMARQPLGDSETNV